MSAVEARGPLAISASPFDFTAMHAAIQAHVDAERLSGAVAVVLDGTDVVDMRCWGQRDVAAGQPVTADTIFRLYSNTKPITAVAAMTLVEAGVLDLDAPVERYLPELADRQVLRAGATDPADVEPAASAPTVRQLMCHNAGFTYGVFQESLLDPVYLGAGVMAPDGTLESTVSALAPIPLAYQPGARWQYSVASDIVARLVEVLSGVRFGDYLKAHVFEPLGMVDTDFHVPAGKQERFAVNYTPVDPLDPMKPGLEPAEDTLNGSYLAPRPFQSGGGGLVGTIGDYTRFVRMLVNDGELDGVRVLRRETLAAMRRNHLPEGVIVQLPNWFMPDTVFGLGFAIKTRPAAGEPESAVDEYHWGGLAGTHSWMSPRAGVSGIIFTQRMMGFWHPFSHAFKREVYAAVSR